MAGVSKGTAGEWLAARFLQDRGYAIVETNYRSRFGEIDMIAVYPPYIVFVEVKSRQTNALYMPREAVTTAKQRRILQTAGQYLCEHENTLQPRFDVIEVETRPGAPGEAVRIELLENAFGAGDLHASF